MRLTVCLEGNTEGRVLASVDMEEIVKMTITDDIEKSNFNPQMFKACTDTAYKCGYQQGATNMEQAKQIIIDGLLKQLEKIRELLPTCYRYKDYGCTNSADACKECMAESLERIIEQLKEQKE